MKRTEDGPRPTATIGNNNYNYYYRGASWERTAVPSTTGIIMRAFLDGPHQFLFFPFFAAGQRACNECITHRRVVSLHDVFFHCRARSPSTAIVDRLPPSHNRLARCMIITILVVHACTTRR